MFRICLMTLAFTLTLPFPLQAMPNSADRYDAMDTDKDGRVTWGEFEKAIPSMKKEAFDTIDANKDGALSRVEWDGFRQTHGMQGKLPSQGMQTAPAPEQAKPLIMPPKAE